MLTLLALIASAAARVSVLLSVTAISVNNATGSITPLLKVHCLRREKSLNGMEDEICNPRNVFQRQDQP